MSMMMGSSGRGDLIWPNNDDVDDCSIPNKQTSQPPRSSIWAATSSEIPTSLDYISTTVQIEVCSTAAAGDFAEQFQMSVESSKLKWWKFHIFHPFCGFSSHFSTSQHVCVSWVVVRGKVITFLRIVNRFRLDSVATSAAEKRGKHLSSYSARITQRHTF